MLELELAVFNPIHTVVRMLKCVFNTGYSSLCLMLQRVRRSHNQPRLNYEYNYTSVTHSAPALYQMLISESNTCSLGAFQHMRESHFNIFHKLVLDFTNTHKCGLFLPLRIHKK